MMLPPDFLGWLTFIMKHLGPLIILLVGCLCVFALQRVSDLRSTPLFCIVRVLMIIDIVNIVVGKIHDIPDEVMGKEIFDPISVTVVLIVQCIRWFAQLLALPLLSSLHFLSLYRPVRFRKLRLIHGYSIVAFFLSMSVLLTVPLLTECCGFTYYVDGAFWAFDFGKPGTALYTQLNLVLQVTIKLIL
ncbi:hypothetical protein PRIPAC_97132 [Pristionchus pacificus]|uniref:Uncharacterized protein n=1 Tax=Pristionchus pacificus TaxID=54126 RepID=A0A2A6B2W9_PRIPA|nr:hypothetical protein PRIPAC_97132 [Pristionchus pacificus]|eukprot:PDM60220.1 hypothetical protein PRIPAC_54045 [Pristionchus pacificus]